MLVCLCGSERSVSPAVDAPVTLPVCYGSDEATCTVTEGGIHIKAVGTSTEAIAGKPPYKAEGFGKGFEGKVDGVIQAEVLLGNGGDELKVYPTFVKDQKINISTRQLTIDRVTLYNVLGTPVYEKVFDVETYKVQLYIPYVKPGLYIVKVRSDQKVLTRRIIVSQ